MQPGFHLCNARYPTNTTLPIPSLDFSGRRLLIARTLHVGNDRVQVSAMVLLVNVSESVFAIDRFLQCDTKYKSSPHSDTRLEYRIWHTCISMTLAPRSPIPRLNPSLVPGWIYRTTLAKYLQFALVTLLVYDSGTDHNTA